MSLQEEAQRGEKERKMKLERRCDLLEVKKHLCVRERGQNHHGDLGGVEGVVVVEAEEDLLEDDGVRVREGEQRRAVLHEEKNVLQVGLPVQENRAEEEGEFGGDEGGVLVDHEGEEGEQEGDEVRVKRPLFQRRGQRLEELLYDGIIPRFEGFQKSGQGWFPSKQHSPNLQQHDLVVVPSHGENALQTQLCDLLHVTPTRHTHLLRVPQEDRCIGDVV